MLCHFFTALVWASALASGTLLSNRQPATGSRKHCPGYVATNVVQTATKLTAILKLRGDPCNYYKPDVPELVLSVQFESGSQLRVTIANAASVGDQVVPVLGSLAASRIEHPQPFLSEESDLEFSYKVSPFTFRVTRRSNNEVLFDTSAAPMIFEGDYVRLRTHLPPNPNLYGLGEDKNNLRIRTMNCKRRLHGNHPIYFDHRGENGTHGVMVQSSPDVEVEVDWSLVNGQFLEYNLWCGMLDLYFFEGPSPMDVASHYSKLTGKAAMVTQWSRRFQQCDSADRDLRRMVVTAYLKSTSHFTHSIRNELYDYMYTALHKQARDGTPLLRPLFFMYPEDQRTFLIENQMFYGDSLLVSPQNEPNLDFYNIFFPEDIFYSYANWKQYWGKGVTERAVIAFFDLMPIHVRGGSIIPLRSNAVSDTTRKFDFVVAPDARGEASGSLYLDELGTGRRDTASEIEMTYDGVELIITGTFNFETKENWLNHVHILGVSAAPDIVYWSKGTGPDGRLVWIEFQDGYVQHHLTKKALCIGVGWRLDEEIRIKLQWDEDMFY